MIFFLDANKFPNDSMVGGIKKVKSWYYTYKEAQTFAGSVLGKLGGQGIRSNESSGIGGVKVSYEEEADKIVAIVLSPENSKSKPDYKDEKASEILCFLWW